MRLRGIRPYLATFCARGVAALGNALLLAVIGRTGGETTLGAFSIGLAVAMGIGTVGRFGSDTAFLRFGALAIKDGDHIAFSRLLTRLRVLAVLIAVALAVVVFGAAPCIATALFNNPSLVAELRAAAAISVLFPLIFLQSAAFKALARPALSPLAELGAAAMLAAAFTGLLFLAGIAITGALGLFVLGASIMLTLLAGEGFCRQAVHRFAAARSDAPHPPIPVLPPGLLRSLPDFALPIFIAFGINWGVLLFLAANATEAQVATFAVGLRLMLLVNVVPTVVLTVMVGRFAPLHADGDVAGLRRLARRASLAGLVSAVPVAAVLLSAPEFWSRAFGAPTEAAASVLAILIFAQLVNATAGPVGALLYVTNHARHMRNLTIAVGAIGLTLAYPLTHAYGPSGAAVVTGLYVLGQNLFASGIVRRRLGFWVYPALS